MHWMIVMLQSGLFVWLTWWSELVCFVLTGTCQDQDGEKGRKGHHREILHSAGQRLSHQQEGVWGDCHHPQQEAPEQDCWVSCFVFCGLGGFVVLPCIESDHGTSSSQVIDNAGRENCKPFPCLKDVSFLSDPGAPRHVLHIYSGWEVRFLSLIAIWTCCAA